MSEELSKILEERASRYGSIVTHSAITQGLKNVMRHTVNWEKKLTDEQKECLEMIAHKIGRILSGDPDYDDSWIDIAGYAQLIVDEIRDTMDVLF